MHLPKLRFAAVTLLLAAFPLTAGGQTPDTVDEPEGGGLLVYLDCQRCDQQYLRSEIDFVDYVRDRQAADVHVLVATQATGAGGVEYSMRFIGQGDFDGVAEELRFASAPTDSEDQRRSGMARVLQGGLVRYATRTPLVQHLDVSLARGAGAVAAAAPPARDPWNAWSFEVELGGNMNREASREAYQVDAALSASRTTAGWKTRLEAETRFSRDDRLVRSEWIRNQQRDHELSALTVRSVNNHWSFGAASRANHSTFQNRDLGLRLAPAVEYNVFPYSQATRRELTLLYSVGANRLHYIEETLYGEFRESLLDHALEVAFEILQPWGGIDARIEGSQYFHDLEKYRLEARGGLEVNLFRGLSLDLRASAQRIHDQLHLVGGELTSEEILLRQSELATAYRYGGFVGFSYRFGSIFNSVVNPRMGALGGGGRGGF